MSDTKSIRLSQLVAFLKEQNGASVNDLASHLGVSHMTVRRDLSILETQGVVTLFHGSVIYNQSGPEAGLRREYSVVMAGIQNAAEKRRIGKKASELIEANDVLVLDTGTTTEALARSIPDHLPLTILCYSLNVLQAITRRPKAHLIFAGGYFHPNTLMFESSEGLALIERNRASKAFVSAAGINLKLGVTCLNDYERTTKVAVLKHSLTKILVADSSKIGKVQPAYFADVSDFDVLVTDDRITAEHRDALREQGVEVIVA